MLDYRNALEIRHNNNGTFLDYRKEAADFTRDSFTIALDKDEDTLMVGFYKPINSVYVEVSTANTSSGAISGEYYNGTEFTTIDNFYDESNDFTRNGNISWSRNQEDEEATTIDGLEAYWYRFSTSVTWTDTVIVAMNILFSDDQALKLKFNKVLEEDFLDGESNHNKVHASCRDEIVETMRRKGITKDDGTSSDTSTTMIHPWDLHDVYEVREASTFLCLSKLFFDFSDDPEDIWMEKSDRYLSLYEENIELARVSIDLNDDGLQDADENLPESRIIFVTR